MKECLFIFGGKNDQEKYRTRREWEKTNEKRNKQREVELDEQEGGMKCEQGESKSGKALYQYHIEGKLIVNERRETKMGRKNSFFLLTAFLKRIIFKNLLMKFVKDYIITQIYINHLIASLYILDTNQQQLTRIFKRAHFDFLLTW